MSIIHEYIDQIEFKTNPGGSELEFSPWYWDVVNSNPGQIQEIIYCQSPC